jgi:hypothetical protein
MENWPRASAGEVSLEEHAGLSAAWQQIHASGEIIITLDADSERPFGYTCDAALPEYDVVNGWRYNGAIR